MGAGALLRDERRAMMNPRKNSRVDGLDKCDLYFDNTDRLEQVCLTLPQTSAPSFPFGSIFSHD